MRKYPKRLFSAILISIAAISGIFVANSVFSLTARAGICPLTPQSAYQARGNRSVFYITSDCTKRPIRNPDIFFSYFSSWRDIRVVSPTTLASVRTNPSPMPWGPKKTFLNGSLIKTQESSSVYVLSNNERRQIMSEQVFTGLGYRWNWIEIVDQSVLDKYPLGAALSSSETYPDDTLVRYSDSPDIYVLENTNGEVHKRHISSTQELRSNYRADHVIVLPSTRVFPSVDGSTTPENPSSPTSTPATEPASPVSPSAPTTPVTPGAATNDLVALPDLGNRMYLGQFMGGLYPNGSNYAPAGHDTEGRNRATSVAPVNGKVVMITIGMSNTNQESCSYPSPNSGAAAACNPWSFIGQATSNSNVNHTNLTVVNCARGGQHAGTWTDPRARNTDNGVSNNYDICDGRLTAQQLTPSQVQVAWVKVADALGPMGDVQRLSLPNTNADAYVLETRLGQIVRALKVRYPNLKQIYFSSRIYGGYSQTSSGINPEPYAYEGGFAVKWLIQAQIDQAAQGRIVDSRAGDLSYANTPWLGWSAYIWSNGETAWQNALPWNRSITSSRADQEQDGTHPSDSGEQKVAAELLRFFLGSPYSAPWFSATGRQVTPDGQAITGANNPTTPPPANAAPTVSVTSPTSNSTFSAGQSITLSASAADSNGQVSNVQFLNGNTVLGSAATSPYSYVWSNVPAGTYTITARATDNQGATTLSSAITITVNAAVTPPPTTTPPPSGGQINTANANSGLGTNVSQFNYWSAEISFKDAFRRAHAWTCSGSCTYDSNGWPLTGRSNTVLFAGLANKYPNGQYIALYDAAPGATITYNGSAVKNTALSRPGRDVVDVNSSSGNLNISVNGAVRNIRFIFPGGDCGDIFTYAASASECPAGTFRSNEQTYESQPFHSLYLAKMKNYKSIRFLWWMLADPYVKTPRLTTPISWSNRPKPTDAIWFNKGVPVEYMVQLANTLNADPWFGIPHLANDLLSDNASDPYVRQFATYVRDHLNPNLRSYVEYSNEVWNGGQWGYEQANYAEEQGVALNLAPGDRNRARFRYQAQQSTKLFRIWNDVFGGRGTERVVRVLAAQGANPWTGIQLMDWQDTYKEADALAGAPYIDIPMAEQNTVANYNVDQLFDYINNVRLPLIYTAIRTNITNATARINNLGRPLEYVAYEGGQHLVELGANQTNANMNRVLDAANRDQRMGTVYRNLLTTWKQSGGHLFEHFVNTMQYSAGGVGRFGLLESILQETSPKYEAVMTFIRENPKWW